MSGTTIRKLRRISDGANDAGYILLPPKNWLDAIEKAENKKIVAFAVKAEGENFILTPEFEEPKIKKANANSDDVEQLMREGTLTVKLRDLPKGRIVYRVIKVPRAWVRAREGMRRRKLVALRVKEEPSCLLVAPVFGDKIKQQY
jgi:hypothetical protein